MTSNANEEREAFRVCLFRMQSQKDRFAKCEAFRVCLFRMQSLESERRNTMFDVKNTLPQAPLYREEFEHDNCGI